MDYDYPCNFSRPVSEQLHGTSSTNFSGANPRASSFSTYSNSSFGSSSSTYDSSSSSSSSLGQNGGNSSSSSGGHLASPQSPAYVSMGFTATNSARDSSKQSALFSTLLSKHPNAKVNEKSSFILKFASSVFICTTAITELISHFTLLSEYLSNC